MKNKGVKRVVTFIMVLCVILSMVVDDAYASSGCNAILGYVPYDAYALVHEDSVYSINDRMMGIKPADVMLIEEIGTGNYYATVKYYDENGEYIKEGTFSLYYIDLSLLKKEEDKNNIDEPDNIGGVLVDGLRVEVSTIKPDRIKPVSLNKPNIDKLTDKSPVDKNIIINKDFKLDELIAGKIDNDKNNSEDDLDIDDNIDDNIDELEDKLMNGEYDDELIGDELIKDSKEDELIKDDKDKDKDEVEEKVENTDINQGEVINRPQIIPSFNWYPIIDDTLVSEDKDEKKDDVINMDCDLEMEKDKENKDDIVGDDDELLEENSKEEILQDIQIEDKVDNENDVKKDDVKEKEDNKKSEINMAETKKLSKLEKSYKNENNIIKEEGVEISEGVIPLTDVPQTGCGSVNNWMMLLMGSVCVMTLVMCLYNRNLRCLKKVAKI